MLISSYLISIVLFAILLLYYRYTQQKKERAYSAQRQKNLSHNFDTPNLVLAKGKKILIFAPHQDDEVLMCAGVITHALANGADVKIGVITNGDKKGHRTGLKRIKETIKAVEFLGLGVENIIFFGYGSTEKDNTSFMNRLYHAPTDTTEVSSNVGTQTYSIPELPEYHYQKFGVHGTYNQATLRQDLELAIKEYHPDHIFAASLYDTHYDHFILYQFIVEAIIAIKRNNPSFAPIMHEYMIHAHDGDKHWPLRDPKNSPLAAFSKPTLLDANTLFDWEKREVFTVPLEMQMAPKSKNKKYLAIGKYRSQRPSANKNYLYSYVKQDEFFWKKDFSNVAFLASVSVSSENSSEKQFGLKAIDGICDGYPRFPENEWVTKGETAGAWIKLTWNQAYVVNKIIIYDRPNLNENITSSTLSFSDGTFIEVGILPNNGSGYEINFEAKTIEWVKYTVNTAAGENIGLSEFEVYGEIQCK